jgi:hypothetical protein
MIPRNMPHDIPLIPKPLSADRTPHRTTVTVPVPAMHGPHMPFPVLLPVPAQKHLSTPFHPALDPPAPLPKESERRVVTEPSYPLVVGCDGAGAAGAGAAARAGVAAWRRRRGEERW